MNNTETLQWIYNENFTCVCKKSLKRKNRPGENSTWLSDLPVKNQKIISPVIHKMDSAHPGWKRVQPSENHKAESVNKKLNFPGLTTSKIYHLILKTCQIQNLTMLKRNYFRIKTYLKKNTIILVLWENKSKMIQYLGISNLCLKLNDYFWISLGLIYHRIA